jgi:hypothetical protein
MFDSRFRIFKRKFRICRMNLQSFRSLRVPTGAQPSVTAHLLVAMKGGRVERRVAPSVCEAQVIVIHDLPSAGSLTTVSAASGMQHQVIGPARIRDDGCSTVR